MQTIESFTKQALGLRHSVSHRILALSLLGTLAGIQEADAIYINQPAADALGFYDIWDRDDV